MSVYRFRAWDYTNNKMIENAVVQNGRCLDLATGKTLSCTIMQAIDLKDVNGKEIYERDVVFFKGSRRKFRAEVVMTRDGVYLFSDDGAYDFREFLGSEIEIIGNVYENPWLVKRGDDV